MRREIERFVARLDATGYGSMKHASSSPTEQ
jgi:hypothetical protein